MIAGRLLASAIALAVLVPISSTGARTCSNDIKERVRGGHGCFVIHSVGSPDIRAGEPLVVAIHGDGEITREGRYRRGYRHLFRNRRDRGINAIAIARPHFSVMTGQTMGIWGNYGRDAYTSETVDGLAAALKGLKEHYRPYRLILVGHSGGAMISGILLGRHPGLAEDAVLVAWGCDTYTWRQRRIESAGRRGQWTQRLPARDHIPEIPVDSVKVVAVTGDRDNNTLPMFGQECIDKMKARGIDARFELVEDRGHVSILASHAVIHAVMEVSEP